MPEELWVSEKLLGISDLRLLAVHKNLDKNSLGVVSFYITINADSAAEVNGKI